MSLLPILYYPDPRLRQKSMPVDEVDDSIRTLLDNMLETMYQAPGIGLSAPQVNVFKRVIVADVSEDKSEPHYLVNPKIIAYKNPQDIDEGCLSVPGIYERVERYQHVLVSALGRDGQPFELEADGLLAVCIQHEIDHLNGKLFVDYLSMLKRQRIKKKMEKLRKRNM